MHEWQQAHVNVRRSLELAHGALRAGGLPVGVAPAEMNALAGIATKTDCRCARCGARTGAPMICRARAREPETAESLRSAGPALFASPGLELALEEVWPVLEAAAQARADRRRG